MSFSESFDSFLNSNGLSNSAGAPGSNLQNILNQAGAALQLAGPVGAVAGSFVQTVGQVSMMFGKGRREADIIVPIQNQYGALLQTVNAQMDAGGLTREQLIQFQYVVAGGYAEFDRFTRDPRFTDGRAPVQARNTIRPLVDGRNDLGQVVRADGGTLGNLQKMIDARGGGGYYVQTAGGLVPAATTAGPQGGLPGIFTNPSVFVAPPAPVAVVGAAPAQDSTLLLAGGGLLAAKLLGLF